MAWLVFLDESGFLMAPLVRRSWATAGQTTVLYQRGAHHRKVSDIAALCVSANRDELRFYFRLHARDISTVQVTAFLGALDHELHAPWQMLWDRMKAHRARRTRDFLLAYGVKPHASNCPGGTTKVVPFHKAAIVKPPSSMHGVVGRTEVVPLHKKGLQNAATPGSRLTFAARRYISKPVSSEIE